MSFYSDPNHRHALRFHFLACFALVICLGISGTAHSAAQVQFAGTQIEVAGGPAFPLSSPSGVAVDGAGNVYIADTGDGQIVKVGQSSGQYAVPVVVLNSLSTPRAVASDWNGNLFIADSGNNRILMLPIDAQGSSTAITLATGLNNPGGVAVDSAENVYVADSGNDRVIEIPWIAGINGESGSYGVPEVISTGFNNPSAIAVDSAKTLYIADTGDNRTVKEILTSSGYTSKQLISALTPSPVGVAVDPGFNMWTASATTGLIAKSPWNWGANRFNSSLYVGGGFGVPKNIAVDIHDNVFVADAENNRVMKLIDSSVNFGVVDVGGNASLQTYQFEISAGTTIGSTAIYTQGVTGQDFNDAGGSNCLPGTYSSNTLCVVNVAFLPLASGARNGAVVLFDPSGNPLTTAYISGTGAEPQTAFYPGVRSTIGTGLSGPSGVAVDGNGDIFIADTGNDRVVEIPLTAAGYGTQIVVASQGLSSPMGLAVDGANNLFVISNGNDKLVKLPWLGTTYGAPIKVGSGLYGPTSVAVDGIGNVYIADTLDSAVWIVTWTGSAYGPQYKFGNSTGFPFGIAVDSNRDVFFTSPYNNRFVEVPVVGGVFKPQIDFQLRGSWFPSAIATDGNADLYIVDSDTNQVFMVPWTGSGYGPQLTIAGGFNSPSGIALDATGNIYVADTGNNQIVKIVPSTPGAVEFPGTYVGSSSNPQSVVVQNVGSQSLNLSAVTYPADFPQNDGSPQPCTPGTSLAQGQNCQLSAMFSPLSANPQFSEVITLVDNLGNVPGSQQSVTVMGAGTGELAQTINFPTISTQVYGAMDLTLAATASSSLPVNYQVVSGPGLIVNGRMLRIMGAGSIVVQATQAGNSVYQQAPAVSTTVVVSPATLMVTAKSVSGTYGSIPSGFQYAIAGFVRGDSWAVVSGAPQVTSNVAPNSGVGTYPVNITVGSLSAANYIFQFMPGVFTVKPAVLTVDVVSVESTFGKPLPTLAWSLAGFRNGDTAAIVTGLPLLTTTANSGSSAGTYPITASAGSLAAANYTFLFAPGTLTISPATLLISSNPQTIVYGSAIPPLTYTVKGLVADDSPQTAFSGTPQLSTTALKGSPAGAYLITIGVGTMQSANYRLSFASSTLTIQKATLTVVPINQQVIYGQPAPSLTYTVNGFVNGDSATSITGSAVLSACSPRCLSVGTYAIHASAGTLQSGKYQFIFGTGTLTVAAASLAISANPISTVYGTEPPKFTCTFTGLVNGDTPADFKGSPTLMSNWSATSGPGTYLITASMGTFQASNYTVSFKPAILTVRKALLTVTAASASTTYGSALPAMEYQITGFQNGDTAATTISGAPAIFTTATVHSPIGRYPISAIAGTLTSKNYAFQFVSNWMTITPASLVITANDLTMKAGSAPPTLTFTGSGFKNTDSITTATTGVPALTTSANAKSAVGSYAINISPGTLKASNYQLTFAGGTLTVTK